MLVLDARPTVFASGFQRRNKVYIVRRGGGVYMRTICEFWFSGTKTHCRKVIKCKSCPVVKYVLINRLPKKELKKEKPHKKFVIYPGEEKKSEEKKIRQKIEYEEFSTVHLYIWAFQTIREPYVCTFC